MPCCPKSLTSSESGQAVVETALVFPILLLVVFGIMQFGIVCMNWTLTNYAAFETARQGAIMSQYVDNDTNEPLTYQQWSSREVAGIVIPGKDVLAGIASSILIGGVTEDQVTTRIDVLGAEGEWEGEVHRGEFPHLSILLDYPTPVDIPFVSRQIGDGRGIIMRGRGSSLIIPFEGGN